MKTNALYKRTFNRAIEQLTALVPMERLASETAMARGLGVSRTTVRAVLLRLSELGIVGIEGRDKVLLRKPIEQDLYSNVEAQPVALAVEQKFMEWILQGDCRPGQLINGLDLARQFGVSTSAIRDCLNHFSHYGLLERQRNGRWRARGLTEDFAVELFDIREMMEFRSVERFIALPDDHPAWAELDRLEVLHHELLKIIDLRFNDFSELDHRFHLLINTISPNRFFSNIQGVMSIIFHYHYHWNKREERERNRVAVFEHLDYIAGLKSRDPQKAIAACREHLRTARRTLLDSVEFQRAAA
ncbi:GntR family transcriptional regulator [Pseudochelatococcus sp. G4_1912]|uniref:GntR family transcriptional regulator n=1 Tax=Pseudochelatococcus sp. G4_1912 TaxID=3114288 RepID=UPI0039C65505